MEFILHQIRVIWTMFFIKYFHVYDIFNPQRNAQMSYTVKILLSRVLVFSLFCSNLKTMITWWAWTTSIILVFHVSCFGSPDSLLGLFQYTAITHPSGRTTLVIIYYHPLSFINIGKLITCQSWILWSRLTDSCFSHPWLQQVRGWNIQSCHGRLCHTWLQSSWNSPFLYPWAPIVPPLW